MVYASSVDDNFKKVQFSVRLWSVPYKNVEWGLKYYLFFLSNRILMC